MNGFEHVVFELAMKRGALLFDTERGFTLKSGRQSPYFFNAGKLQDGECLDILGAAYATLIYILINEGTRCDILFGPSYKGIPLVTAASIRLSCMLQGEMEHLPVPFVYNRKEAKDHGEGGVLVGEDMKGKHVVIVDDVITAGTAVEESVRLITEAGGIPAGLVLILDRQEKGKDSPKSAIQEVEERYGFPVQSMLTFDDLVQYQAGRMRSLIVEKMQEYRRMYGA